MSDSKKKYEEIMAEEAEQARNSLASALAAASKARHQERVPDEPVPEPEKVESPAPDEIEEMSAAEVEDIKKDISEIRSMITDNNRKLSKILSKLNFASSNTKYKPTRRSMYKPSKLRNK